MMGRGVAVTGGSKFRRPAVELWTGLALFLVATSGPAAQPEGPEGLFITVPNPITSEAVERIQKQIEARKPGGRGLGVIVFDFNPDGKPAWTSRPGVCSDLTHLIRGLRDKVTTVAYVHNKVSGNTVMPVLACDEIIMSRNGSLGEITRTPEEIEPLRTVYEGYFLRGDPRYGEQRFALIKKMYDPQVQLRRASSRKDPNQKVYVDARDPNVDKLYVGLEPVRGVADNAVAVYTAEIAREVGLRRGALAESRLEVAEMYGLPAAVVRDDPLGGRDPQVFTYVLRGEVDGAMRESVQRVLRNVRSRGGNVLILELHCGGHDLVAARGLAEDLRAAQSGDQPLQIIAFIPESAPAAGTVVALGCTQIVMTLPQPPEGGGEPLPSATLGDFSRYVESAPPKDIEAHRLSLRELARLQGYPEVLIDGMLDRQVEIVRAVRKDDARQRRLMTRADLEAQANEWQLDKVVKHPGEWWVLDAALAKDIGLARYTVPGKQVSDVASRFGFRELRPADPGWLDRFAEFLRKPVVTVLLVVIGFTGLILELKVPGLTVPGIVAALCFILVFWSQSRFSGQTFVLALLLFLLGLVLVGIEIFVLPGFGAPGLFGILSMLAGLALVTFDRLPESGAEWGQLGWRVLLYLLAMLGALLSAFLIARFLPKVPYANRLILEAPAERGERAVEFLPGAEEAAELLGAIGTSHTPLRPAGVVRFGEKFVDVVSDGSFIPAGTRVQVIQVEGTRIVVKEV